MTQPSAAAAAHAGNDDYQAVVRFNAPPEAVFEALTTAAGFSGWWMPASGSGVEGGELHFKPGDYDPVIMRVDEARRLRTVRWTVLECKVVPDWAGTRPCFDLAPHGTGGCELRFRHHGLTPQLECFDMCKPDWDRYLLTSLHKYVESGHGNPAGSGAA